MMSAQSVIDFVSTVLDEERVRFDTIEETQVIRMAYRGQHARYRVLIRATDEPLMLTAVASPDRSRIQATGARRSGEPSQFWHGVRTVRAGDAFGRPLFSRGRAAF